MNLQRLQTLAAYGEFEVSIMSNGCVYLVENHEHVSVYTMAESKYGAACKAPDFARKHLLKQLEESHVKQQPFL